MGMYGRTWVKLDTPDTWWCWHLNSTMERGVYIHYSNTMYVFKQKARKFFKFSVLGCYTHNM